MTTRVFLAALVALLSGCVSPGHLEGSAAAPDKTEAVFVMGVSPDNYIVSVVPGRVIDGYFRTSPIRSRVFYALPKDGYIVGKALAGELLAITMVKVVTDHEALAGKDYISCSETKMRAFKMPPSGVVYLGDVRYASLQDGLMVRHSRDLDAARRHVDANFPALKGRLEPIPYELVTPSSACSPR